MKNPELKLGNLQGAVFDVDGVLVDTEYFQWQGWREVLKPYGKSLTKQQYFLYAGKRGDIIEAELIHDLNLKIDEKTLYLKKEELLFDWINTKQIQLMPNAKDAIKFFLKKKIKVACASGSPKDETRLKLEKTGILTLFQTVVSGSDVKRGKPFPDIYLSTVESLGLNPEKCIAFEDTQYGVSAAKSAGLFCFAVPNEFTQKQDFSKADGVFKNLKEAISALH